MKTLKYYNSPCKCLNLALDRVLPIDGRSQLSVTNYVAAIYQIRRERQGKFRRACRYYI